jgi:hypothetical protein
LSKDDYKYLKEEKREAIGELALRVLDDKPIIISDWETILGTQLFGGDHADLQSEDKKVVMEKIEISINKLKSLGLDVTKLSFG